MKELCHMCNGTGRDEDAEQAASPGRCPNCNGKRFEPEETEDEES